MKIGSLMVDAGGKTAPPSLSNVSPLSRSRITYPQAPCRSLARSVSVVSSFFRSSARFGSGEEDGGAAPRGDGGGMAAAPARSAAAISDRVTQNVQRTARRARAVFKGLSLPAALPGEA